MAGSVSSRREDNSLLKPIFVVNSIDCRMIVIDVPGALFCETVSSAFLGHNCLEKENSKPFLVLVSLEKIQDEETDVL